MSIGQHLTSEDVIKAQIIAHSSNHATIRGQINGFEGALSRQAAVGLNRT